MTCEVKTFCYCTIFLFKPTNTMDVHFYIFFVMNENDVRKTHMIDSSIQKQSHEQKKNIANSNAINNRSTMCDFHNFGLIFTGLHCLPQRLKSTFYEICSNGVVPKFGASGVRIFFKKC